MIGRVNEQTPLVICRGIPGASAVSIFLYIPLPTLFRNYVGIVLSCGRTTRRCHSTDSFRWALKCHPSYEIDLGVLTERYTNYLCVAVRMRGDVLLRTVAQGNIFDINPDIFETVPI